MIYVALLRGINVGGNNQINMKLLKTTFERVGMGSVKTYINSGNIIFTNEKASEKDIGVLLEEAIFEDFGLRIKVLIRNFDDFHLVAEAVPEDWKNDQSMKSDVFFLWEGVDASLIVETLRRLKMGSAISAHGAVLWSADRESIGVKDVRELTAAKFYKEVTVRNVNTVRKIYKIMKDSL